jgi:hypothetical protein
MNNFYLYRMAGSTLHRFISWDKDLSVTDAQFPILSQIGAHALARNALSFPDLRDLYLTVLRECARVTAEEGWFSREVERLSALIRSAVDADPLKPFSTEEVEATFQFLTLFAAQRPQNVLDAVDSAEGLPRQ